MNETQIAQFDALNVKLLNGVQLSHLEERVYNNLERLLPTGQQHTYILCYYIFTSTNIFFNISDNQRMYIYKFI